MDDILNAKGDLLNRYRQAVSDRRARTHARRAAGANGVDTDPQEVSESNRRQVIALAGAVAFGAALPQSAGEIIAEADTRGLPGRVEIGDVRAVERTITGLEERDHQEGGVPTRQLALGELRWAISLLGGSFLPGVRQRLQRAIAYLADLAAWTTADAGRVQAARKLFILGLKHAHDSEDAGILAHVATGFARLETQARQPRASLDLVRLARSGTDGLPQPAVSMLHVVTALALARLPDPQGCYRHIGLAQDLFRSPTHDDPAWIAYFTAAKLHGDTGVALFDLWQSSGRRDPSLADQLANAMTSYPDSRARSKAIAAARLGVILYGNGEMEEANNAGSIAITVGKGVRSARLAEDIAALGESARRFPKNDRAQEIARMTQRLLQHHPALTSL